MASRENAITWDEAVALTREWLLDNPDVARGTGTTTVGSAERRELLIDGADVHRGVMAIDVEMGGGPARAIVRSAKMDPDAFDACMEAIANMQQRGQPMPRYLDDFASKVAAENLKRPAARPGKHPQTNYWRNIAIATAVERLKGMGVRPTRNEATGRTASRFSACDVVAKVLEEVKILRGTDAVQKIWQKYR